MTVSISVSFSEIQSDVKRHLSVIGKRAANGKGENIFSSITLSSIETPILDMYMLEGSQNVVAAIERFVSNYSESDNGVAFYVTNTRWNDPNTPNFYTAFSKAFKSYLVNFVLSEYLSMNFPELAKKYLAAAINFLQAIIQLVFFKAPPVESGEVIPPSHTINNGVLVKSTMNIGTSANPRYIFRVPVTDFKFYNITSVEYTDLNEEEPEYSVIDKNNTELLVISESPCDIDSTYLALLRNQDDYVDFVTDADISPNDTFTLIYTV